MKVVQINTVCGVGSTGKITVAVSELLTQQGAENYIFYSFETDGYVFGKGFCSRNYTRLQSLKSRILGNYGFNSEVETRRMIAELERIKPNVVHLHNIHSHDCNLTMLFDYLRSRHIKVFWTFHDCWAFTGYCCHFTMAKCNKWRRECYDCPQYQDHISWFFDRSTEIFRRKRAAMLGVDLTIITPSQWLADLVKQSFLKDYPVKVIHNGIDLNIFKPRSSNFREKYGIQKYKYVLLGVAAGWGNRKGLDVFLELFKRLPKDKFQIVLVGTDSSVDKQLPKGIISIHRTQNQTELAEIYTAADLFVNPTREENYPTVNMESIACGMPVLTFRTGGSPEILTPKTGSVVECDDVDAMEQEILRIEIERPFTEQDCLEHAKNFDMNERFKEYVELYREDVMD